MNRFSHSTPAPYEIQVRGHLGDHWASRFEGFSVTTGFTRDGIPVTTFSGLITDQAALHGMITVIRDMGLQLLSVNRLGNGKDDEGSLRPHEFQ